MTACNADHLPVAGAIRLLWSLRALRQRLNRTRSLAVAARRPLGLIREHSPLGRLLTNE